MTSAHQADVLELIFKEKSRGLLKKKAAQTAGRAEGSAESRRDERGLGQTRGKGSRQGRGPLADGEHVGTEQSQKAPSILTELFLEDVLAAEGGIRVPSDGAAGLPNRAGDLGLSITL